MKVLCCLGIREAWAMVDQALARLRADQLDLLLVYVINQPQRPDARPLLSGLGRHHVPKAHAHAMNAAEESSGQISLQRAAAAAEHLGVPAARIEQRLVRGHFEHIIVELAEQEQCDVVVLRARDEVHVHVPRGPASIGHSARFILDHVPCDVLLVRS